MSAILQHRMLPVFGMVMLSAVHAISQTRVTVDLASAYYYRGAFTDGLTLQPGIEAWGFGVPEKYGVPGVGVWGNYGLNSPDGSSASSQFSEIQLYANYYLPTILDGLDLSVGYTEYTYPVSELDADKEANVGIGYGVGGLALYVSAYLGVGGNFTHDVYYSLSAYYTAFMTNGVELSAGVVVGYYDPATGAADWNDALAEFSGAYWFNEIWYAGASVSCATLLYTNEEPRLSVDLIWVLSAGVAF